MWYYRKSFEYRSIIDYGYLYKKNLNVNEENNNYMPITFKYSHCKTIEMKGELKISQENFHLFI